MDADMMDVDKTGLDHVSLSGLILGVAGLGLMGGSLALGLAGVCARRIGMDPDPRAGGLALERKAIDERVGSLPELVERADVIVLAAPVRGILAMLRELADLSLPTGASRVVLDIGSTKREVMAAMERLGRGWDPIGGHPICGREVSGIAHADGTLFRQAVFVLCPFPRTSPRALGLAQSLAGALGATPLEMDVSVHDRLVAATSHLPYLAAVALALTVDRLPSAALAAGSGFRDTSRLAGSSLEMMTDILATNRDSVLDVLNEYIARLEEIRSCLQQADETQLRALLEQGRRARETLLSGGYAAKLKEKG